MATQQPERILPTWLGNDTRTTGRQPLALAAMVSGPRTDKTGGELLDVSTLGCRVRLSEGRITMGAFISIEIRGFTTVEGWVAWFRDREAGVIFAHSLPPAVVAHLLTLGANESTPRQ